MSVIDRARSVITPIRPREMKLSAVQTGDKRSPSGWTGVVSVPDFMDWYCPHGHRTYEAALDCARARKVRTLRASWQRGDR